MKFLRVGILTIAAALLFSGCSFVNTKLARKSDRNNTETAQKDAPADIPFVTDAQRDNAEKTAEKRDPEQVKKSPKQTASNQEEEKREEKTQPQREKIIFSPGETEHIRLAGYNPFTDDAKMELSLDVLGEEFCYPYPGKVISGYGYRGRSMHTGVDIKAVPNDTIRSVMPGVVRMSKPYSGYGNVIVVRHYNGLESIYSHNSKNLVTPNDVVEAGQPIALAGRTGRATTEHLHFEMRIKGEHFNPTLFLDTENHCIAKGVLSATMRNNKLYVTSSAHGKVAPPMIDKTENLADNTTPNNHQTQSSAAQTTQSAPKSASAVHTVRKGDTLYSIARSNGTTVANLCRINNISEKKILQLGEKIKLY